jgi:hypothetical protein
MGNPWPRLFLMCFATIWEMLTLLCVRVRVCRVVSCRVVLFADDDQWE